MSKAAAETGLRALAQGGDMRVTVIRPPLVYGAGAKGNFQLLARAIELGIPLPFAAIANQRSFLSVQNLASFVLQRLAHAKGAFDVFLLADEEQVSTPEFMRRLARSAGATSRLFRISPTILNALFRISGQLEARDSLIGSLELDVSKAASTGWRPPLTMDEGLILAMRDRGER
jgi:UDP-glucose 4-epimerase